VRRKAKVTKKERRRTPRYHGEGPKKDSAYCEASDKLQEGEEEEQETAGENETGKQQRENRGEKIRNKMLKMFCLLK